MSKNILQALPELIQAGVISPETAGKIRNYYLHKNGKPGHTLVVLSGILGALLVGLGLILILAHNWNELTRVTRISLAFLPLVLGQALTAYVLWRKNDSRAWRESTATFLFLAVGASIALVSQIYHIPGNLGSFLFTWMLLGLPLVYLLGSSAVSLLYLLGITFYAVESRDLFNAASHPYFYWLLLLGIAPHYYRLYRYKPESKASVFHHWVLPLSVCIALITVGEKNQPLLLIAFFSLFSLFCFVGTSSPLAGQSLRNNGYLVVGTLGTAGLLLALSFDFFWQEIVKYDLIFPRLLWAPEFIAALLTSLLALALLVRQRRRHPEAMQPGQTIFLFFLLAFAAAFLQATAAVVLLNLLVLWLGIDAIRRGARWGLLGQLNYGLLLVSALIACRFFDAELSFVFRGFLFVLVGAGFFFGNFWLLQKRKTHE